MSEDSVSMTATDLLATASRCLEERGYRQADSGSVAHWPFSQSRLFEDQYGIVAIVVYETWGDLSLNWIDAQASLVDLMSQHMSTQDAKAWEGYLVLLTPSLTGRETSLEATRIRYDVSRVRKLVVTGNEIRTIADVETFLLPLLPLEVGPSTLPHSVLELLPNLLEVKGIPTAETRVVIDAFLEQKPIVESLHEYRSQHENKGN
jgi:hypothetical protein